MSLQFFVKGIETCKLGKTLNYIKSFFDFSISTTPYCILWPKVSFFLRYPFSSDSKKRRKPLFTTTQSNLDFTVIDVLNGTKVLPIYTYFHCHNVHYVCDFDVFSTSMIRWKNVKTVLVSLSLLTTYFCFRILLYTNVGKLKLNL